jgi:hypothetical protein
MTKSWQHYSLSALSSDLLVSQPPSSVLHPFLPLLFFFPVRHSQ